MNIDDIKTFGRSNWGDTPMSLAHIALAAETICGDIARQARNNIEGQAIDTPKLKKELGNLISSTIRWCDDLGFDPKECIELSHEAQKRYIKENRK